MIQVTFAFRLSEHVKSGRRSSLIASLENLGHVLPRSSERELLIQVTKRTKLADMRQRLTRMKDRGSIQQWSERIAVAKLGNEPSLSDDLLNIKERLGQARAASDVILDLSGVTQVNSSNLSQLLRIRKLSIESGAKLLLAGPTDSIWAVFLTTGLDKLFEFTEDVATALAGIQMYRNTHPDESAR